MDTQPFRWSLNHRRPLESLLLSDDTPRYYRFDEFIASCGKLMSLTSAFDLVFVGRSVENYFDYFSGAFEDTSWRSRLTLLQFSAAPGDGNGFFTHAQLRYLKEYFCELKIDPKSLLARDRPIAFVDVVHSGQTYDMLVRILKMWSDELGLVWTQVRKKIILVAIICQYGHKCGQDIWYKWFWTEKLPAASLITMPIEERLWCYIANSQPKVTRSYIYEIWGQEESAVPQRQKYNLDGLRLAMKLYEFGKTREGRRRLAEAICQHKLTDRSARRLVNELRHGQRRVQSRRSGRGYLKF